MSGSKRIENIIVGILMLFVAVFMILFPTIGLSIAVIIISFVLLFRGVQQLIYFFTMAIHANGGKNTLIEGILFIDCGLFFNLTTYYTVSRTVVLMYLIIFHAFTAAMRVMRALEARKGGAVRWRRALAQGIFNAIACILCIVFFKNKNVAVWIFAVDLILSACDRIADSFRRSAVVYSQ